MLIQLIRDKKFDVDFKKLKELIESKTKSIKIEILDNNYDLKDKILVYKKSNIKHKSKFKSRINSKIVILATDTPYDNNYFLQAYGGFIPISFYLWEELTELPRENGMLYWIADQVLNTLQTYEAHEEITGCINDFLWDKHGIDAGMRQGSLCPGCLSNMLTRRFTPEQKELFKDVKCLLNYLSEKSKWGLSIFDRFQPKEKKPKKIEVNSLIPKRPSLEKGVINVLIASPSDVPTERKDLYYQLPIRFDKDGHEKATKFRVKVSGWEDLASQPGVVQEIINNKLLTNVDVVIGILKHRLGTPTQNAVSGSAEEILYALEKKPDQVLGMVYYFSEVPIMSFADTEVAQKAINEWKRLEKFKRQIEKKVLFKPYSSSPELVDIVIKDLANNIKNYFCES